MSNQWIDNCIADLMSLKGRIVEKVFVCEMAFIEKGQDEKPVFEHPLCPFLQAGIVYLCFSCGENLKIVVHQTNNWSMGLLPVNNHKEINVEEDINSIYRTREVSNFPTGKVESISIIQNEDEEIAEITLVINQQSVLLKTGEVYENTDGSLNICSDDESIFLFMNSDDVKRVSFSNQ